MLFGGGYDTRQVLTETVHIRTNPRGHPASVYNPTLDTWHASVPHNVKEMFFVRGHPIDNRHEGSEHT